MICQIYQIFAPSFELHNLSSLENTICLTPSHRGFVAAASGLLGAVRGEASVTSPWSRYPAVCDHSKASLGVRAETPCAVQLAPSNGCSDVFYLLDFTSWRPCVCVKLLYILNVDFVSPEEAPAARLGGVVVRVQSGCYGGGINISRQRRGEVTVAN